MKKTKNKKLNQARVGKNDEFYTLPETVESQLAHYRSQFKGKVVFCNCDDPKWSSFYGYFKARFVPLGLKRLITTHYNGGKPSYKLEYNGKTEKKTPLKGDGDFRSDECVALLKQADIVVTNPPFSLFREYVGQLVTHKKKFLVIGNMNAISYKETFPLIQRNKLWLGVGSPGIEFKVAKNTTGRQLKKTDDGYFRVPVSTAVWFTNLPHKKRNEEIVLYENYTARKYPKYENYNAIEVGKTKEIPADYKGEMGVPISFLYRFNPKQFKIIGTTDRGGDGYLDYIKKPHSRHDAPVVKGVGKFTRLIIKRV